jgi:hypothetical protein
MKKILTISLTVVVTFAAHVAHSQTTRAEAFSDAKTFKSKTSAIKAGITPAAMDDVPGKDPATTSSLSGLYGSDINTAGTARGAECAGYIPGPDAYANQNCETINYVRGNPSARPVVVIDRATEPLATSKTAIQNNPTPHTAGMSGLTGTYSACSTSTTTLPGKTDTERCQIGREVTEASCRTPLLVTYAWELYVGQGGADLRYGYCSGGDIRGDLLTIPASNTYVTDSVTCASKGHGTGMEDIISAVDCLSVKTAHGYNASSCSAPPIPALFDPVRLPILSCTSMPRTNENCFTASGGYTGKVTVPVFVDTLDDSACASLRASVVPIL